MKFKPGDIIIRYDDHFLRVVVSIDELKKEYTSKVLCYINDKHHRLDYMTSILSQCFVETNYKLYTPNSK